MKTIVIAGHVVETVDLGHGDTNLKIRAKDGSEFWVRESIVNAFKSDSERYVKGRIKEASAKANKQAS